jgi:hypothetical protein
MEIAAMLCPTGEEGGGVTDQNIDRVGGTDKKKCDFCSLLEQRTQSSPVEKLVLSLALGDADLATKVAVDFVEKNQQGLIRLYQVGDRGKQGYVVILDDAKVMEAFTLLTEEGVEPREACRGETFGDKVIRWMAYKGRIGRSAYFEKVWKAASGVRACEHFEDIQERLGKSIDSTQDLMDIIMSRRC